MKIVVNREKIIEGLQKAASIIPPRMGQAYLRSLWLKAEDGKLTIFSTDANIEFTGTYDATVTRPGLVGVPGKDFVDLVRRLPVGDFSLTLDAESGNALIEQGRKVYRLAVGNAEWFQNPAEYPAEGSVVWSGDFFQDILDKVAFCINDDDSNDAIGCLYLHAGENGKVHVCGLNGHQFALRTFIHDELSTLLADKGLLLQKKYLSDIKKWLGVDEIELNLGVQRFYLRRLDGTETLSLPRCNLDYPDYNVFMSKLSEGDVSHLVLNRKEAVEALSRIVIFNSDTERCTFFDLSTNEACLTVQGQNIGSASEELEAGYDGSIKRIAFPTKDLLDVFEHFRSEQVELLLTGTEGPCGISGKDDPDYTVIIMPMKISENSYYSDDEV